MSKTIIAIIIIIIVAGLGYWVYQSTITPEELTEKEQACIDSGGTVSTSLCCKATGDFPNLCLIGPCGCSPDNSYQVKICDCGLDKCFNGSECVSLDEVSVLLEDLEQETGIDFSEVAEVEFKWVVKVDPKVEEVDISGKGFEATDISSEQYDSVESFLIDRGFEKDLYNMADGTFVGLKGYKKDQIVCTVSGGSTPQEPDINDVTVKCGKLEITIDMEELSQCAKDGERFSTIDDGYPGRCCEGLKEWSPIPDTRFSIADVCYEVGLPSESNIGLCIKCGDGICENHLNYDENPCNCPEDCAGKNKSMFQSIEEFCQSNDWKMSLSKACEEQEPIKGSPICELCAF